MMKPIQPTSTYPLSPLPPAIPFTGELHSSMPFYGFRTVSENTNNPVYAVASDIPKPGRIPELPVPQQVARFVKTTKANHNQAIGSLVGNLIQGNRVGDHRLAMTNDTLRAMGSMTIAGLAGLGAFSGLLGFQELIGVTGWLSAMTLTPLVINTLINYKTGLNLGQYYVSNQHERKRMFMDVGYIPYDYIPDDEMKRIADKMGISADLEPHERNRQTKAKIRQIAAQGNTWWMLAAGIATPVTASVFGDQLTGPAQRGLKAVASGATQATMFVANGLHRFPPTRSLGSKLYDWSLDQYLHYKIGRTGLSDVARAWGPDAAKLVKETGLHKVLSLKDLDTLPLEAKYEKILNHFINMAPAQRLRLHQSLEKKLSHWIQMEEQLMPKLWAGDLGDIIKKLNLTQSISFTDVENRSVKVLRNKFNHLEPAQKEALLKWLEKRGQKLPVADLLKASGEEALEKANTTINTALDKLAEKFVPLIGDLRNKEIAIQTRPGNPGGLLEHLIQGLDELTKAGKEPLEKQLHLLRTHLVNANNNTFVEAVDRGLYGQGKALAGRNFDRIYKHFNNREFMHAFEMMGDAPADMLLRSLDSLHRRSRWQTRIFGLGGALLAATVAFTLLLVGRNFNAAKVEEAKGGPQWA